MTAPDLLVLHSDDNVATALHDIERGSVASVSGEQGAQGTLMLAESIRLGHKAALTDIDAGATVVKHGQPIGRATLPIMAGEHVHVHNVQSLSVDDQAPATGGPQ